MMMYYGGLMMWGWMFLGLLLVGLLIVATTVLVLGGITWLQRQGRGSAELRAEPIRIEEPRSVVHR